MRRNTPILQSSNTPLARIRGQPARRSLPEFQTTGRSREDEDEAPHEWHPMLVLLRLTDHQSLINNHVF
jgi:hypothetical protein